MLLWLLIIFPYAYVFLISSIQPNDLERKAKITIEIQYNGQLGFGIILLSTNKLSDIVKMTAILITLIAIIIISIVILIVPTTNPGIRMLDSSNYFH
jgi:hypothetical protein